MYVGVVRLFFFLEENEVRTMVDPNSKNDRKLQELMKVIKLTAPLCLSWLACWLWFVFRMAE